ncbi:hypothetical protein EMCG_05609 [[Emmonsia] crescens]|uniref:Uncharacterized protein n=1 Tax=[Emmonsia] crescens TaxID=73230 RepID=A0A0G2IEJ0_9EURO|nr:hypothetical protein EMCG_05609 [Emmonsia crescens UAMH 3008]
MAVRAITVNQWVRGLSGLIVPVPPLVGGGGGGGGGAEDDFPATVRDFWKLGGIDKRDALARLAECYGIHNNGWQDCRWGRRVERSDDHHAGGAAQFVTLRDDDAVSDDYPMRCLRALATVWGLAFDLLERPPPDLVIVVAETGAMVTAENEGISHG